MLAVKIVLYRLILLHQEWGYLDILKDSVLQFLVHYIYCIGHLYDGFIVYKYEFNLHFPSWSLLGYDEWRLVLSRFTIWQYISVYTVSPPVITPSLFAGQLSKISLVKIPSRSKASPVKKTFQIICISLISVCIISL